MRVGPSALALRHISAHDIIHHSPWLPGTLSRRASSQSRPSLRRNPMWRNCAATPWAIACHRYALSDASRCTTGCGPMHFTPVSLKALNVASGRPRAMRKTTAPTNSPLAARRTASRWNSQDLQCYHPKARPGHRRHIPPGAALVQCITEAGSIQETCLPPHCPTDSSSYWCAR